MSIHHYPLTRWTIRASGASVPSEVLAAGEIDGTVPGSVHTDLLAAGLIPDPYLDQNEKLQTWIGLSDWTYRTTLKWSPDGSERQLLVFGGIDTVATVRLNGQEIGRTRNMHRTHRFDVTDALRDGDNEVEVAISSPVRSADEASLAQGYRPHANHHPYNAIRKMACSFGWDWGIDTSTSALWKPVELLTWSGARFREVRLGGDVIDGVPTLRGVVEIESSHADTTRELHVRLGAVHVVIPVAGETADIDLPIPDAELWWPHGYGAAHLHSVQLSLVEDSVTLDDLQRDVGFRSVELRVDPDDEGIGFTIVVNDCPVHVRGANWIPDDAFLHRVDRARYARRLDQAEFAGINLLRVWGGGIYESDDFYTECDARGILTWQDFLLACAAYAEEEPLWSEFEAEAREAIVRLAAHPSLVVLNGNNENTWGRQDWNWGKRLEGRTWGERYYYELFPRLVEELAPHVGYTPGSPFSPDPEAAQNDPSLATVHIWDLWNQRDWPDYRAYRPRFVSEFGWQGPPTWSTLTSAISDDPLTPESPGMIVHQKALHGNDKLTDGLTAHFPLPSDMADWHWAMSLNQAIAVRTAIEWYRSLAPHCTGTIVWQLNDCWPVTSWAAIDGAERPKPLLYALRGAHAERLVTIQPESDNLQVALVNDSGADWSGTLEIERRSFDGSVIDVATEAVSVPARTSTSIPVAARLVALGAPDELLVARIGEDRALWFFVEPRGSALEPARLRVSARQDGDSWVIAVAADVLVRDLALLADRVSAGARTDRALDTLLPGESIDIRVSGAGDVDPSSFSHPDVLRSANDLVNVR